MSQIIKKIKRKSKNCWDSVKITIGIKDKRRR